MPRDDKVAILKESLAAIGRRIEIVLDTKQAAGEDRERWRRHLWTCVNDPDFGSAPVFDLCILSQVCHVILAQEGQGRETRRDSREDGDQGGRGRERTEEAAVEHKRQTRWQRRDPVDLSRQDEWQVTSMTTTRMMSLFPLSLSFSQSRLYLLCSSCPVFFLPLL